MSYMVAEFDLDVMLPRALPMQRKGSKDTNDLWEPASSFFLIVCQQAPLEEFKCRLDLFIMFSTSTENCHMNPIVHNSRSANLDCDGAMKKCEKKEDAYLSDVVIPDPTTNMKQKIGLCHIKGDTRSKHHTILRAISEIQDNACTSIHLMLLMLNMAWA